ncbi:unnamed protein product [Arabis nemorensis]|uniref:CCHC-type domain-containing protein n=1 Tax=Arabis nemorensis TaxID=586526 RepID=A0A565CBJ7_9BRAS|nr:unnamed protein product [Arabis nemorensis]
MVEEAMLLGDRLQGQSGNVAGKNKNWVKNAPSGKSSASRSVCSTCGKMHVGEYRTASGACHRCGSINHKVRDCPEEDQRAKNPGKDAGESLCYNCGEVGHYKNQCPKLRQQVGKRASDGPSQPAKRQAIMPRVYTIGDKTMDPIRAVGGQVMFNL